MLKQLLLYLVFSLLMGTSLFAKTIYADFNVSYGIFGQIGVAKAMLKQEGRKYHIEIQLKATGLAKLLSGGREEQHISKGRIKNGLMVSDFYQVIKSYRNIVVKKEYRSDHEHKRVEKIYQKYEGKTLRSEKKETLGFYATNDLLTLYFNLHHSIKDKSKAQTYVYRAIGAERQQGKVSVIIPDKRELERYKEALGDTSDWYATAVIHQQIFSSKEGRLLLGVADDGITDKAVLKDVIFFGDIRAVRVK
jgi:hypothetical protein